MLATNVEFWSAVMLDLAEVPPDLFTPMFTCARVAGWSAHILEQKREAQADPSDGEVRGRGATAGVSRRIEQAGEPWVGLTRKASLDGLT